MLGFGDSPIAQEVADVLARRLPVSFGAATFPIELPAGFAVIGVGLVDGVPRLEFGNVDGTPVVADQVSGLSVYAGSEVAGTSWEQLANALVIAAGRVQIIDPGATNAFRFYRVQRDTVQPTTQ